jgi:sugar fermentation stimulation protein A
MRFTDPLVRGTLVRRYKRFLADVRLASGRLVTAHCPNPGSMLGLAEPGRRVLLSRAPESSTRRLGFTWEAVRIGRTWVCVNTQRANQVAREALCGRRIPPLARYTTVRPEVALPPRSRIDFLLSSARESVFVEVKSVTLRSDAAALFPDAVTERGRRHLRDLMRLTCRGERAVLLYLVMRDDCRWVGSAESIDPEYARTLRLAVAQGVLALAYTVHVSPKGLALGRRLPLRP